MTTKQIQYLLAYLGYDVAPDGIIGKQTRDAVKAFQKEYGGLAVDGDAGVATCAALRKAVGEGWTRPATEPDVTDGTSWDGIRHFKKAEFACKCGRRYCNGYPAELDMDMVRAADEIRARIGKPIRINSGLRCRQHNANEGGVSNSRHMDGLAADLGNPAGVTPAQMAAVAEDVLHGGGGIGIYSWGIHIDTRQTRSRWNG